VAQVEAIWNKFGVEIWEQLAKKYPDVDVGKVCACHPFPPR
jgi:hypothetical protein